MDNASAKVNSGNQMTELEAFIEQIIDEQGYATLDEETKNTMKAEMAQVLLDQIDRAAINELSEEKAAQLADKLDAGEITEDQVADFMREAGVNLEEVAMRTMLQFKMLYSGGGADDETAGPENENGAAESNVETSQENR